jgi:hypothetical protein
VPSRRLGDGCLSPEDRHHRRRPPLRGRI